MVLRRWRRVRVETRQGLQTPRTGGVVAYKAEWLMDNDDILTAELQIPFIPTVTGDGLEGYVRGSCCLIGRPSFTSGNQLVPTGTG